MTGAGEELFRAYYADVYRYLYSLCRDAALSEDLAQETFLSALRALASFRGEAEPKTWLFAIARRVWLTHLRRTGRRREAAEPDPVFPAPEASPEELLLRREAAERIDALLAREGQRTAEIMRLRLQGWSYYELGRRFGLTESSVRVICFRARNRIWEAMEKEGFTHE